MGPHQGARLCTFVEGQSSGLTALRAPSPMCCWRLTGQVVSSFSSSLYVPWPSLYYALANSLNVVSLQFLKLPAISCIQPGVSFLTVFNGVTISTLIFIVFCLCAYYVGARTATARADPERRRRFKTRCLNAFIWGLFLVYPQVSSTTLLIFACSPLENDTYWLMADYRVQCWTGRHRMYVGLGCIWTALFPIGIPLTLMYALYRARVPALAAWKRDCAWLRAIVQRAMVLGAHTDAHFDPDTITLESISLPHLQMLHKLFVAGDEPLEASAFVKHDADGDGSVHGRRGSGILDATKRIAHAPHHEGLTVRQLLHAVHAAAEPHAARDGNGHGGDDRAASVHHAPSSTSSARPLALVASGAMAASDGPGSPSAGPSAVGSAAFAISRRGSLANLRGRTSAETLAPLPSNPLLAFLERARRRLAAATTVHARSVRRVLSSMIFHNEREQLLGALLEYAKHDKHALVSEPRHNQMRWRTVYEWEALRAGDVKLGERDTAERGAFYKYSFLFSSYACHAWYW